ncbi:NUCLEAR FUSION DEFECTIVE 4-like [Olea europaea subsp. europaea]|uniref:NUCLEAR FUSION DEFECTIVE 4-like n=1 Tax=Olea europaea subsp. europaea TaxID=158383 RepID=A0A8S0UPL3_OLEEU|nr:NUCLEAR FUSION DEFECTIVE 4-like [Olea europaea subsp. europaea]
MAFAGGGSSGDWPNMRSFAVQVLVGRWFMVFATILVMSAAGATYMFGLYSAEIKSSLGYDQTTLNLLSFFKDLGSNVGILSGLINEVTPPWVVLSIGAVLNFFGYFMIWLARWVHCLQMAMELLKVITRDRIDTEEEED